MTDEQPPHALYRSDVIDILLTDPSPEDVVASLKASFQFTDEELTPMVVVRLPARDWNDFIEAVRRDHGIGVAREAEPVGLSRAASRVAQGKVLADGPPAPAPRPPGTMSRAEIEAMDVMGVLARLAILMPRAADVPLDAALPEGVVREFLAIGHALDRWWNTRTADSPRENEAVDRARAWMHAHKLPTTYRP